MKDKHGIPLHKGTGKYLSVYDELQAAELEIIEKDKQIEVLKRALEILTISNWKAYCWDCDRRGLNLESCEKCLKEGVKKNIEHGIKQAKKQLENEN